MNINKGHEYALNQEDGHLDVFPPAKGLSYMTHKRIPTCISSICLHNYAQAADCRQKLLKKPDKFRRIEKSGSFIRSEITSNVSPAGIKVPITFQPRFLSRPARGDYPMGSRLRGENRILQDGFA